MPSGNLNMLDLAQRTGSDAVIGLVEDVTQYSPEFREFLARPMAGTTYKVSRRVSLPPSGFRNANSGTTSGKSGYVQEIKEMYFLDCLMEVDEAIYKADPREMGDVLADEASGALESAVQTIGSQVWYGTAAGALGYSGLSQQISADAVYAGGTTNTTSAYLVNLDMQGVHFDVGNQGEIALPTWARQQLTKADGTKYFGMVTNLSSYIGLAVASAYSVYRARGIDKTNKLTDALGAAVVEQIPASKLARGRWVWFMNTRARYTLQMSRTAVGQVAAGTGGGEAFAPTPTSLEGLPIIVTDSLVNTETTTAS